MRARWLKPEFFRDRKIAQLGPLPALVYEGLWVLSDDGGVAPGDAEIVKGDLFMRWPDVDVDAIEAAMVELETSGRIHRYAVGDEVYAEIPNLLQHQKIKNPSQFRFPRPTEGNGRTGVVLPQPSPSPTPTSNQDTKGTKTPSTTAASRPRRAKRTKTDEERPTWLTPYMRVWTERVGEPVAGKMARFLRPVHEAIGPEATLVRLGRYLEHLAAEGKLGMASPARFAEIHNIYAGGIPTPKGRSAFEGIGE